MTTEPQRIYWDSCAYISCIEETPGRRDVLWQIVRQAEAGEIVFVASALVIAEVSRLKNSPLSKKEQARKIQEFFENDFIKIRVLDRKTAEDAAEIGRQFGLRGADTVHVATALRAKCHSLQTYDGENGEAKKLLAFDGRIGTPPLKIELPRISDRPRQLRLT